MISKRAEPAAGGETRSKHEQFLEHLVEHGLLMGVSDALDAVLHRIGVES